MKFLYLFPVFLLSFSFVFAEDPKPVLFGEGYDGVVPADGSLVSVYIQGNPSDNTTDIVGETGKFGVSGYWKVELNNLATDVQDTDTIVLYMTNAENETARLWVADLSQRTVNLSLNYNPDYQDYDDALQREVNITVYDGWTLFSLPFEPLGISNSEELGQAIMQSANVTCDVIIYFDGTKQEMVSDLLGQPDRPFNLSGTDAYFVGCDGTGTFTYEGKVWV